MQRSWIIAAAVVVFGALASAESAAAACQPTGYPGLTAVLVNPVGTVSGVVDAAGCNVGVYYDSVGAGGRVNRAEIKNALHYGVFVNGDYGNVEVDVLNSSIHDIGDHPFNGNQRGVAVYYRGYYAGAGPRGRISGNIISAYQKGGIVANGAGTRADIIDNIVMGFGPIAFIAQNGIQVGYGACPDGSPCAYTVNTRIVGNTVTNNDIGVFLTNIAEDFGAPATATNVKAVNNVITNVGLTNNYGGFGYQAGVSDVGNNDKIITNRVSGPGYDPDANPSAYTVQIDADASFTNRPKVHANK